MKEEKNRLLEEVKECDSCELPDDHCLPRYLTEYFCRWHYGKVSYISGFVMGVEYERLKHKQERED